MIFCKRVSIYWELVGCNINVMDLYGPDEMNTKIDDAKHDLA
jgi:hypothetical protein